MNPVPIGPPVTGTRWPSGVSGEDDERRPERRAGGREAGGRAYRMGWRPRRPLPRAITARPGPSLAAAAPVTCGGAGACRAVPRRRSN